MAIKNILNVDSMKSLGVRENVYRGDKCKEAEEERRHAGRNEEKEKEENRKWLSHVRVDLVREGGTGRREGGGWSGKGANH